MKRQKLFLLLYRSMLVVFFLLLHSCIISNKELEINSENLNQQVEACYNNYVYDYNDVLFGRIQLYIEGNKIKLKSAYHRALYTYLLGAQLYNYGDYLNAKVYLEEAKTAFTKLKGHREKLGLCYNDLGLLVNKQGNLNRGLELLNIALTHYDASRNFGGLAETHYNIAAISEKYGSNDWYTVREHGYKSLSIVKDKIVRPKMEKYLYTTISRAEMELGNLAVADSLLVLVDEIALPQDHKVRYFIYEAKGRLYKKYKDNKNANEYFLLSLKHASKHMRAIKRSEGMHRKNKLEFNKKLYSEKLNTISQQKNRIVLAILFIILILVCGTYYVRLSNRIKRKSDELNRAYIHLNSILEEKNHINKELKASYEKIENLLILNNRTLYSKQLRLSVVNEKIKSISKSISSLTFEETLISPNKLLGVEKQIQEVLTGDEEIWEDFKTHFEEILPSFFHNLKAKCPGLSINELKQCSYIVSHLRTKDVAKLTNVSPRAVETARYRIKKKIGLNQDESLLDFLQEI